MLARPQRKHHYHTLIMDTDRWDGFESRPGDVFVSTSYKAGTTWMQMICALLIFGEPDFHAPLTEISPWLERRGVDVATIHARYAAQTHRRFIKTHSPLDSMPYFDDAVYLYVGRDPRDVFMSLLNQRRNSSPEFFEKLKPGSGLPDDFVPPDLPDDDNETFRVWLTTGSVEWEHDGFPYWSHLRHALTFWEFRHLPNLHFFHYADLSADLDREMRRVAEILEIPLDEARWPELVAAATFDAMKARADELAPEATEQAWKSNRDFFHHGRDGRWRDVLDAESLALYDEVMDQRVPRELRRFLEEGGASRQIA